MLDSIIHRFGRERPEIGRSGLNASWKT
ncbi:hypothetical protein [Dyadobacter pollutisoli]